MRIESKIRKKFDCDTIQVEIQHFLETTKASDDAGEYLLSQLVYTVGELPKHKQVEFLNGLINAKQELV